MTKQTRLALTMAAVMSAGMLAGCPPVAKPPETRPVGAGGAQTLPATLPEAPVLGVEPVAKGVYVAIDRRAPLRDQALTRARMTENQVFTILQAAVNPPSTLPATAPAPAAVEDRDAESPPQAVKYYLQGRGKFLEGANSEATTALEKALQLDPQAFTVLRLMGRVCFASSQLARGAMYLQRAQALRPRDVEVNYLLGRYWIERNDFDKASYFLLLAAASPERQITSTFTPLSAFYLGIALQLDGYHLAAAHEYERFLELAEMPVPGYRYDGELGYLINMQWAAHLASAENFARLGDYHAALPHYRAAAAARPDDPFITSRLVNALVRDGQPAPAQKAALALVSVTNGGDDAVRLLGWTYQAAGRESDLIADLRARLQISASSNPASEQAAAITLAATQEYLGRKLEAQRTLGDYLERHPANLDVLGRLLKRVDSAPAFALALNAAADAIAARRDDSLAVLRLFVPVSEGQAGAMYINAAIARQGALGGPMASDAFPLPPAPRGTSAFALYYLEALTRQAQNRPPEQVETAFEASLKADGAFFPATEAYVSYLLTQERFDKATVAIDALMEGHQGSAKAWQLQIESETAQQRYVHALQLAQEASAKFPDDADLRLETVRIYRLRGQNKQADAELQRMIKDMPRQEIAYRALVNSLLPRLRGTAVAEANASLAAIVAALNKLSAEIPDSRFGRLTSAVLYARGGRLQDAENLLRSVLVQDPDDPDALVLLAQVEDIIGRTADGIALLESALRRKPQLDIVRTLATLYRNQDRKADALALAQRHADENPDSEAFALYYVDELTTQDKRPEALARMTLVHARFPRSQSVAVRLARMQNDADDHDAAVATLRGFMKTCGETTERLYLLSHFYATAGNDDSSVAALQRLLAIMPDNIGANNDLGYFWVNAGIHLEQAEPMIRKALENKPDDPAFLDSLAWLYYKQGKFPEAAALLQKALAMPDGSAPEVIQHFADTLYRLGRQPEAVEQWAKALQLLSISGKVTPADLKERDYLTKAVTEARAGRTPNVTPTALSDQTKAAGPVSAPATMPQN
jgi:tetratricopeptide (TPR) repeat protein